MRRRGVGGGFKRLYVLDWLYSPYDLMLTGGIFSRFISVKLIVLSLYSNSDCTIYLDQLSPVNIDVQYY